MKKLITAAALLIVGSPLAWAQGGPPNFDALDTDGDGSLNLEELTAMFAAFGGMGGQAPDPEQIMAAW
ncbi:MAG: EF-hand domain-containing protein, partial [Gammaproteobacteria bacterium]